MEGLERGPCVPYGAGRSTGGMLHTIGEMDRKRFGINSSKITYPDSFIPAAFPGASRI